MIELSKRMRAVADLVPAGSVAADIGCDHGFVSIYLIQRQICSAVYAADVRPGPLSRAKEHIEREGLADRITTVLSDGLKEVPVRLRGDFQHPAGIEGAVNEQDTDSVQHAGGPYDADGIHAGGPCGTDGIHVGGPCGADGIHAGGPCGADGMLAAGMGGKLMIRILSDVPEKTQELEWVVLEPQSEVWLVRRWLWEHGFVVIKEKLVFEEGKYYPVMLALNCRKKMQGLDQSSDDTAAKSVGEALEKQEKIRQAMLASCFSEEEAEFACDWLGGQLILQKDAVLKDFLNHTIENDCKVLDGMPDVSVQEEKTEKELRIEARRKEIQKRLDLSARVLKLME